MTNRQVEEKIRAAFVHAAPEDIREMIEEKSFEKGSVIQMKQRRHYTGRILAIAAALLLAIGGALGIGLDRLNRAVASVVSLDVNPSVEIQINRNEKVLRVVANNPEGEAVIGGMDFRGSGLDVTVNALVGSMLRQGYLTEIANSILVSVDGEDAAAIQAQIAEEIGSILTSALSGGSVLSQTIAGDANVAALAEQYGITVGKAQLISEIVAHDARYQFADLVELSINELNLLSASGSLHLTGVTASGTASQQGYVGAEKAREIALGHAGVTGGDEWDYSVEMDYERGKMVYEIEFSAGGYEYDYEIDAVTGEIVLQHREGDNDAPPVAATQAGETSEPASGGTGATPSGGSNAPAASEEASAPSAGSSEDYITASDAQNAALSHAGVSRGDARGLSAERDWERGKMVYEVEFSAGGYEYDYEIDAVTGSVIRYDKERDD